MEIGLDIGRSATQQNYGTGEFGQFDSRIAGVVARRFIRLLISPFMLLVNNYQPQVGLRGKEGAAGADSDIKFTLFDLPPLIKLLAQGELAVKDGDPLGKA